MKWGDSIKCDENNKYLLNMFLAIKYKRTIFLKFNLTYIFSHLTVCLSLMIYDIAKVSMLNGTHCVVASESVTKSFTSYNWSAISPISAKIFICFERFWSINENLIFHRTPKTNLTRIKYQDLGGQLMWLKREMHVQKISKAIIRLFS